MAIYETHKELFDEAPLIEGEFILRAILSEFIDSREVEGTMEIINRGYVELCKQTRLDAVRSNIEIDHSLLFFPRYKMIKVESGETNREHYIILILTYYGTYYSVLISKSPNAI